MTAPRDLASLARRERTGMVIVGIGNDLKGDDGVGPWVARRLAGTCTALDGATVPEALIPDILAASPHTVLLVDAARMGARPGSVGVFTRRDVTSFSFSTHAMPLSTLARILEGRAGCDVFLVCIEPASLAFGQGLTPEVEEAATYLVTLLNPGTED